MTDAALDIQHLTFSVRGAAILKDVSVRMGAGDIWCIIGPNGAGKSTLLKCLMRIHTDWSGRVTLFGRPLNDFSQRKLARQMAYVPQAGEDALFPYTVRAFVRMARYAYAGLFGNAHPDDASAVDRAMKRAGVAGFAHRTLSTLSGGERQKVFIAGALAQGGRILLLDEPTAFLDYHHQTDVSQILRNINKDKKTTIIMVTHDVNTAILTGSRILALKEGSVAWTGPAAKLADKGLLTDIFQARFRFVDDPETGCRLVLPGEAAA